MVQVSIVSDELSDLGESPVWDPNSQKIYWLDCFKTSLCSYEPRTAQTEKITMPCYLGAIGLLKEGGFIATTALGFAKIAAGSSELTPIVDILPKDAQVRMNDGKCDPLGRFWAGSAVDQSKEPLGELFCLDADLVVHTKASGFVISNGIGFAPDHHIMYHNDSKSGVTYCYDFDLEAGTIDNRRVFWRAGDDDGLPDGLTVDAQGGIWIALWNGYKVIRLDPQGRLDMTIDVPTKRPTSLIFGGANLSTLFITTCNHLPTYGEVAQPSPAGALLAVEVPFSGLPEPDFAG